MKRGRTGVSKGRCLQLQGQIFPLLIDQSLSFDFVFVYGCLCVLRVMVRVRISVGSVWKHRSVLGNIGPWLVLGVIKDTYSYTASPWCDQT